MRRNQLKMDCQKKTLLFVDKIKRGENLSSEERDELLKEIKATKVPNFLVKYELKIKPEELYLRINGLKEPPKCIFCGSNCKFISLFKGYKTHCNSTDCKRIVLEKSFGIREENTRKYDEFISEHKDFYNNVEFPFTDICEVFSTKVVKNLDHFKHRSFSGLRCLDEVRECIFCKKPFVYNRFYNNNLRCNSKSCRQSSYNKLIDEYKSYSEIPIKIFVKNKKYNLLSNDELLRLFKKYDLEKLDDFIKGKCIEFNGYVLKRTCITNKFSYIKNGIIEDDMMATCKCCGKKYVKFDKQLFDGKLETVRIGAEYSCGSKECYYKCAHYYPCSDEERKRQSDRLKLKIKNGEFKPNVTNSWCHSRVSVGQYAFRSSWEAYFYVFMTFVKKKDIKYEDLRISYFDSIKKETRNYVVDFVDWNNRVLFEIKPLSERSSQNVKDKEKFAKEWCIKNNFEFKYISNEWFEKNYNSIIIRNNINDEGTVEKLLRNLRGFEHASD